MSAPKSVIHSLKRARWMGALTLLVALACNAGTLTPRSDATAPMPTPPDPTLTPVAPPPSPALATPSSQEPASGICRSFEGPVVEIQIEPGIPDPRCGVVSPDQRLKVLNKTDDPLDVMLGTFAGHLEPGGEYTIDVPFGEYLAPGVHHLQVLPCCGAAIVLEDASQ